MHLTSIKTASATGIPGVEFIFTDKAITEVVIGKVHIRKNDNYGQVLAVYVETPHVSETRFRLTAKIDGFPDAVSYYATKYEADQIERDLAERGAKTIVDEVKALIDENGEIVGIDGDASSSTKDSDFPF